MQRVRDVNVLGYSVFYMHFKYFLNFVSSRIYVFFEFDIHISSWKTQVSFVHFLVELSQF